MKKILTIALVLIAVVGVALAAMKEPSLSTSNVATYGRDTHYWKIQTYTLPTGYVTSAKSDTVLITSSANDLIGKDGSILTLYCNFDGNNEIAADSGDIVIKVEIGADSGAYYSPAFAVSDTAENTLNDSTYSFNKWTVQPDNGGTQYLALPFNIPAGNVWSRMKIISSSARMNAGDTCFLYQRQLQVKRYTRP